MEVLDGFGKTSLATSLSTSIADAIALKTPSPSLKGIWCLFDKLGEKEARAFYFMSHYTLENEIEMYVKEEVIVVDGWYASSVAYFLADRYSNSAISSIPNENFMWPNDLHRQVNLMLTLDIDPGSRRERVKRRCENWNGVSS